MRQVVPSGVTGMDEVFFVLATSGFELLFPADSIFNPGKEFIPNQYFAIIPCGKTVFKFFGLVLINSLPQITCNTDV